ncbi:hypothetical protein BDFB_008682 [Asbolus verrucosus]|uniref:Uncharacterized protein n=1 Tax=Asbolus verrucosus TaxID=1661398 RepID=A0A482VM48_ASBVE|nr:hypothetical protein BDFB_008682 [Asbolus verrucosus]
MLLSVDWSCLTAFNDVNTSCSKFYSILNNIFEKTVPKFNYNGRQRRYFPSWFNNEILLFLRMKSSAFKKYKKCETSRLFQALSSYCLQSD